MNPGPPNTVDADSNPVKIDESNFETIYREYWRSLYDFIRIKVQDRDAAEEILQETFVNLWERRDHLRIINIRNYLFTAVKNRIIDYFKQKLFADLSEVSESPSPDYPHFLDELEESIKMAINDLPPKTREIFKLNRVEGRSVREISVFLKIPERTIEYHISQATKSLKTLFRYRLILLFIISLDVII